MPSAGSRCADLLADRAAGNLRETHRRAQQLLSLVREREVQIELNRRKELAASVPQYLKAAQEADVLAIELGQKLNLLAQLGRQTGQHSENPDARRLLSFAAIKDRVLQSFYLHFFLDLKIPGVQSRANAMLHWFGWEMNTRNNCDMPLAERERLILDGAQDIFDSEYDARQTAARLDPSGLTAHVLPLPDSGLFKIMRVKLRGAAAKLARQGAAR